MNPEYPRIGRRFIGRRSIGRRFIDRCFVGEPFVNVLTVSNSDLRLSTRRLACRSLHGRKCCPTHPTPPSPTRATRQALAHTSLSLYRCDRSMKDGSRVNGMVEIGTGRDLLRLEPASTRRSIVTGPLTTVLPPRAFTFRMPLMFDIVL